MKNYEPIITSLLDTDFYKFTMGQVVFRKYKDVQVKYVFKNRTASVNLGDCIDEKNLRCELDHVRELKFGESELRYLRGTKNYEKPMFSEDYLEFLGKLRLPPYELKYRKVNAGKKEFILEFPGKWPEAIYWEIPALAIINEQRSRSFLDGTSEFDRDAVFAEGTIRLARKITELKHADVLFSDFGTRRRFSKKWQEYVVKNVANELPRQFIGTSNVKLAMVYGYIPMGTDAHERSMGIAGLGCNSDEQIRNANKIALKDWWETYGHGLSIFLPDTFGSDAGLSDMTQEQAKLWKGLRQDSGDPIEFGEKALAFYRRHGVDPKEKIIVFSDGLTVEDIVKIHLHFKGKIKPTFGWGTNLTNDLGLKPLSLVVKLMEINGHGTVKLSDNISKAMGKPEDIERYKNIFGYSSTLNKPCVY